MTPEQIATVDFYKGYNVDACWFTGTLDTDGRVEVIALGRNFVWSLIIEPDGTAATSEAELGDFSTGIEV